MKKIITIDGMSCEHCKKRVEAALSEIEGVADAKVNLKNKTAVISMKKEIEDSIFKSAIEKIGFKFLGIEIKKGLFGK